MGQTWLQALCGHKALLPDVYGITDISQDMRQFIIETEGLSDQLEFQIGETLCTKGRCMVERTVIVPKSQG